MKQAPAMLKLAVLVLVAVGIAFQVMYGDLGNDVDANHEFAFNVYGFYIVDFALFALLLGYAINSPLKAFLANRRQTVAKEMDEAGAVLADAETRLTKYQGRLTNLAEEAAQLEADFRADGERQQEQVLAEADAEVARLKRDFETRQGQDTRVLADEISQEIATQALTLAESKIQERLTPATHRALIKQYLADLSQTKELGEFRKVSGGSA